MGDPVISLSPVTTPVVRTGLQGISGAFITQGLGLFGIVTLTPDQQAWLTVAFTTIFAFALNSIEKWQGRKLIGATPPK